MQFAIFEVFLTLRGQQLQVFSQIMTSYNVIDINMLYVNRGQM